MPRPLLLAFLLVAAGGLVALVFAQAPASPAHHPTHDEPAAGDSLKDILTPLQYHVTQENGTEPPFQNAYWDHHEPGIYVDIVSGEPLFSSLDKFDSGTGWPSFTRPLEPDNIRRETDASLGMMRNEIRSVGADSHLGHVFPDGPGPTGDRFCINSVSLTFDDGPKTPGKTAQSKQPASKPPPAIHHRRRRCSCAVRAVATNPRSSREAWSYRSRAPRSSICCAIAFGVSSIAGLSAMALSDWCVDAMRCDISPSVAV